MVVCGSVSFTFFLSIQGAQRSFGEDILIRGEKQIFFFLHLKTNKILFSWLENQNKQSDLNIVSHCFLRYMWRPLPPF